MCLRGSVLLPLRAPSFRLPQGRSRNSRGGSLNLVRFPRCLRTAVCRVGVASSCGVVAMFRARRDLSGAVVSPSFCSGTRFHETAEVSMSPVVSRASMSEVSLLAGRRGRGRRDVVGSSRVDLLCLLLKSAAVCRSPAVVGHPGGLSLSWWWSRWRLLE